jgi:hypothetical protein
MAPEKIDHAHSADIRADLYRLGWVGPRLPSGRQGPFAGLSPRVKHNGPGLRESADRLRT